MPADDNEISIPGLIALYERQPAELDLLLSGLTRGQLCARPIPGKWSVLEVLCHLSDSEWVFADRMKRTLVLDNPRLITYAEASYAVVLRYQEHDPIEELATIRAARTQMARILRGVAQKDWSRTARLPRAEPQSLRLQLRIAVDHFSGHLATIRDKRVALGLPADSLSLRE